MDERREVLQTARTLAAHCRARQPGQRLLLLLLAEVINLILIVILAFILVLILILILIVILAFILALW